MTDLRFNNYSRFLREKHDYRVYAWCVFLDEPASVLDQVTAVEYVLHPTFPDPVRRIWEREHCFALLTEGWGTFGVEARVYLADDNIQRTRYRIKLEDDDWPRGPELDETADENKKKIYGELLDDRYEWRKLSTLVRRTGMSESELEAQLAEMAASALVRKADFRSIDSQDLWGATSRVGLLPTPRP